MRGELQTHWQALDAALAAAGPEHRSQVATLVSFLREKRSAAAAQVLQADPHQLAAHLADLVDAAVGRIHDLAVRQVGRVPRGRSPIALLATGGYGRRQLCPFSDVDIALVADDASSQGQNGPHADLNALLKVAHRLILEVLQDGLGLEVGYAYRPVGECPQLDHATRTALLDARFVAGNETLFAALRRALRASLDPLAYMQAKAGETAARRARFGDTPYHLEPDVKNSAGGLRDLQVLRWIAAACFGVEAPAALEELQRRGVISSRESERLLEAEGFLLGIRCWLHFTNGTRLDVLLRSKQQALAAEFGRLGQTQLASPQGLMSRYYQCAAAVAAVAHRAVRHCLSAEMDLGDGFIAARGQLRAAQPDLFEERPAALIRAFELAQRYGLTTAAELQGLVRASLHLAGEALRTCASAARHFRAILGAPARVAGTLRDMWEIGLLPHYMPEISGLEALVPTDPTHQLTVGAHTLRTIANLEGIPALDSAPYDQLRGAYADIQDREVLVLASLLHDAGKAEPEGDHCQVGARLTAQAARRLGLSEPQCRLVTDLVRKHLLLVRTARLQDSTLPSTITNFAQEVGSVELLNMLYVLSYADTAAVGPAALTDVNRQQADELYFRALKFMLSGMDESHTEERVRRIRQEAERRLRAGGRLGDAAISRHLQGMPSSYLLSNEVGAIGEHISFVERVPAEELVVHFYNEEGKQFTELTVCCRDDPEPGLFAKIAGTLYANDVSIHSAQLYTRADDDIVLDLLWVDYRGRQVAEAKQQTVRRDLADALTTGGSLPELLSARGKPPPQPLRALKVRASNSLDADHTVLQLVAADQPGLLYRATQAMASLSLDIHSARITTWRGKAEDAFYVKQPDGHKLSDCRAAEVERQLTDLLARR